MRVDLWGKPLKRSAEYCVFHDESEPNKRWLLIGMLFVNGLHLDEVRATLSHFRRAEQYYGEIHFSALPKSFGGAWGGKARVARQWLRCFQNSLSDRVFFSALAVDRHSPAYKGNRFPNDFHAYNRFTAMALKAGIAWHLNPQKLDEVSVHFVSDAKDRASRPDKGMIDNFEDYLPYRAELDAFLSQADGRPYPSVSLDLGLQDSASEELLQFCDLLLGATQMALVAGSAQPTKRELGEMVVRWREDLRKPPWQQQWKLHRRYNLWAFPDERGRPHNSLDLALRIEGQASLL